MSMSLKKKVRELTADDASQGADITTLKSDVTTLKSDVGANDTAGLKKRCKDIETTIGDEDTAASILGRIKALEDAQPSGTE